LGIPVFQPESLKPPEVVEQLRALAPDVIVVAAYGHILRRVVLELPPHGCVNVHASLLPRWRGASPISAAIAAGDPQTGVTIMRMGVGLDDGPMLSQRAIPIEPNDTTGALTPRLAQLGADLLAHTLPGYLAGEVTPIPQDTSLVTLCRTLKKEEGQIDWRKPAIEIERHARAMTPWPGAFTFWGGKLLKIMRCKVADGAPAGDVGQVAAHGKSVFVSCGVGALELLEVQPEGKKPMPIRDFINGQRDFINAKLGGTIDDGR
jgi:methionyl-tRNA formyltransferase